MARSKQSAKRPSSSRRPDAQAEHLSKSLSESAQQIWLAGVGAFGRAQAEGTRLFEGLVKEGASLETTARRFAGHRDVMRDAVETRVGQAREHAVDTWDRLEKAFETRVHKTLVALGVPGRDDLHALSQRVDELTAELRRQRGGGAAKKAAPSSRATGASRPAKKATPGASPATARPAAAAATAKRAPRKTAPRKPTSPRTR
ncbi:phasin family protein [Luteimonas kalidii]|uniref:Phasin family protein n=1 Tax=Luteimonas kalidii TaxID=3042025 RepID=A0ABT6JT80_9GAMM|nr:phasin family protein [Luteimonas kalidii]MDH5833670.1 phasin family protein [Luteimonas kalidii]